ncbi:MAG: hypothetical protein WEB04_09160 [Dehalococcoidia bacterium]
MRRIAFITLAAIVLAVAGAACSDNNSGGTKPTATATVEEQEATSTQESPEPTDTQLPPPSAEALQSVVATSLSLNSSDVLSVISQRLSQDQRNSLFIGLGSPNLTASTGQASAAAYGQPERVSDGWQLGYVLAFDGRNIGYAEATLSEEQDGWKIVSTCRWDTVTSTPVRPKPNPDRCWPQ